MARPGYTDITFEVKTEHVSRLLNGLASHYGYRDVDINDVPNPETKQQYTRRKIMQEWKRRVLRAEVKAAQEALSNPEEIDIAED